MTLDTSKFTTIYMDRRLLLKLMAAAAVTSCAPNTSRTDQHVVVVGAGIIGASIAYHLSELGVKVTVLDGYGPASHATRGNFAWINASWAKQPRSYHSFNQKGVSGWGELSSKLMIPLSSIGSLEWFADADRQTQLAEQIREQADWGEAASMIEATELAGLEENVAFGDITTAALSGNDRALDPVFATEQLLAAVEAKGALIDSPNTALSYENGVLKTEAGPIACDHVVIATGADNDAPQNLAGLSIPQRSTPGLIAISEPLPKLIDHIIVAPGVHIHQRADGRVVIGEQDGAPDTHGERLKNRPIDFPQMSFEDHHKYFMQEKAGEFLPALYDATIEDIYIGWRPLPLDGHPVLGFAPNKPNVSIAITHSGVTLAPVIGQLMAEMIFNGKEPTVFKDYRPDRDLKRIVRY